MVFPVKLAIHDGLFSFRQWRLRLKVVLPGLIAQELGARRFGMALACIA